MTFSGYDDWRMPEIQRDKRVLDFIRCHEAAMKCNKGLTQWIVAPVAEGLTPPEDHFLQGAASGFYEAVRRWETLRGTDRLKGHL